MRKSKEIKTKRLILKSISNADYESIKSLLCNHEVSKTYMIPDFTSEEDIKKLFNHLKDDSTSDKRFVYGIYYQDKLIGFINDTEINNELIEVGYVISPNMKKQGFASEALTFAIQELFRIGFLVVRAGCFIDNIASKRVMEKSGMHLINKTDEIKYRNQIHQCIYFEIKKS